MYMYMIYIINVANYLITLDCFVLIMMYFLVWNEVYDL